MKNLTMWKPKNLILVILLSQLVGQNSQSLPQPNDSLPEFVREDSIHVFLPDTIATESENPKAHLIRKAGIGIFLLSGLISIHYQQEANSKYEQYLRTGNPSQMDRLYKQTANFDRYAGWSYVGLEAGIILFIYSFYE